MIFHRIDYADPHGQPANMWRHCPASAGVVADRLLELGMKDVHVTPVDIPLGDVMKFKQWLNTNPNSPNLKEGTKMSTETRVNTYPQGATVYDNPGVTIMTMSHDDPRVPAMSAPLDWNTSCGSAAAAPNSGSPLKWPEVTADKPTAPGLLKKAADIMEERGKQYDKPDGERSMGKAVMAFNAITGQQLSEAEGWLLLQVLKDVRLWQRPGYHQDSAEDCVAYSALKAEAKSKE